MSKLITNTVIVVIGIGRLGASIAKQLSQHGENVLCIDSDEKAFNKLDDFSGFTQVGDATDLEFLRDLGIANAKTIIITTENDDTNIYLGHVCFLLFNCLRVFIRLDDSDKKKLLKDTPIEAIYPFLLSLNNFMERFDGDNLWE